MIAGGDYETDNQPRLLVGLEEREVLRRAHLHGDGAERVHDRGSKRHERQRRWNFGLKYVVSTLRRSHAISLEPGEASVVSEVNGA